MTSIDDVARECGVSTATVSRALRGLPRVSEDTRARVLEAAVKLGYVPSPHAVGLASGGRTRTVAVVVPFVTRWYFSTILLGAEQELRRHDHDLALYNLGGDPQARERVLGSELLTKRVDALIIVGIEPTATEQRRLARPGRTVVTVGLRVPHWPSVSIDDEDVAVQATRHLLELGHTRIAYVGGLKDEGLDFTTPRLRLRGYRRALSEAGLAHDPRLEVDGGFTSEGGIHAWDELAALDEPPTAVFAASDEMAIGVLHRARERGLSVPGDLSVIGIDDHEMSRFMDLTTLRQPVVQQGRIAARQALHLLSASIDDDVPEHVSVPTELVVRGTTGPRRP
ncbi:LacI family DNA-binding transcriptional regulator [Nocardioides sp. GY 10127]|uniref:LacI family DNA-binding transcriptional regulator n=1 Tax=Nocardioides sp. GY 10127 TaxID=2569762 RepID=UPI0010A8E385|nr:LacI family DNA-binding transcriptional regulator [Nocardioides sp. GY 10127]TIC81740.1 LacI family transcriptional regulator [Nocardioides sp. GY 10127]